MTDMPSGAHVEIIERASENSDPDLILANGVIINGQEILIPEDSTITISPISTTDCVTVNLTMFVASLTIRRA